MQRRGTGNDTGNDCPCEADLRLPALEFKRGTDRGFSFTEADACQQ
jgi:hypothetical protein